MDSLKWAVCNRLSVMDCLKWAVCNMLSVIDCNRLSVIDCLKLAVCNAMGCFAKIEYNGLCSVCSGLFVKLL